MAKKNIIKINESQLKEIIVESVKNAIEKTALPSRDDVFDINEIPIEILDKGWQRYHPYLFMIDHRSPFANRVPNRQLITKNK